MNTGLKTVDNLIRTFGIRTRNGADKSQSLVTLSSADERLASMRIPFCMMQKILSLPQNRSLRFHQWYLPHKGAKLACFLIDEEGRIVEQVYFQRDTKHVNAARKLQQMVEQAHRSQYEMTAKMAA